MLESLSFTQTEQITFSSLPPLPIHYMRKLDKNKEANEQQQKKTDLKPVLQGKTECTDICYPAPTKECSRLCLITLSVWKSETQKPSPWTIIKGLGAVYNLQNCYHLFLPVHVIVFFQSAKDGGFVCLHSLFWLKFQDRTYIAWVTGLAD